MTVFLLIPTVTVVVGAFTDRTAGSPSTTSTALDLRCGAPRAVAERRARRQHRACIGAVLGALLAYLIVSMRPPTSLLRRRSRSVCGVLAQFGGVTLAFAFIATLGFSGVLTDWRWRDLRPRHLRLGLALRAATA